MKKFDNFFNSLTTGGRLVVVAFGLILIFGIIAFMQDLYLKYETSRIAEKFDLRVNDYIGVRLEAEKYKLGLSEFFAEMKKSKESGFDKFSDYMDSKKFGLINYEEYIAIKKLDLSKEQWELGRIKMKEKGLSPAQYVAEVIAENERVEAERKAEADRQDRIFKERVYCAVGADGYLRSWGYIFKWDDSNPEFKFGSYDSSTNPNYGKYGTNSVAIQSGNGVFSRRKIMCTFNRATEATTYEMQ